MMLQIMCVYEGEEQARTETTRFDKNKKDHLAEIPPPIWKEKHLSRPLSISSMVHILLVAMSG